MFAKIRFWCWMILILGFVGWVVAINLPGPEFEVTEIPEDIRNNVTHVSHEPVAKQEKEGSGNPNPINLSDGEPEKPDSEKPKSENDPDANREFDVNVVNSPGYLINLGGLEKLHPFDIRKYEKIHEALKADKLLTDEQTLKPAPLEQEDLLLVHGKEYLESLQNRKKLAQYLEAAPLLMAPVSLDRAVLQPFRRASGGTLLAGRMALRSGIGVNIGGGYHHAKPNTGEGFCVYADVPIAIRKLQKEGLIKTALVIDVDVHQGNGTILCLDNDDTTFTFSMHQAGIYPIPKEVGDLDVELGYGMGDLEYMEVLNERLPDLFEKSKPDICFIVGGCDPLAGDPLASLKMTPAGIVKRDDAIVKACVERNVPVVLTLSGGYSPEAWKSQYMSIKNLIESYGLAELK